MSSEKAEAIVIRQADFSESSRVVTLFSKEFGKSSALAKGAKRLKGPFDAAIDLLSHCRVVFIRKSAGTLDLLTEARLIHRFRPESRDLNSLYGGFYFADLVCGLTEEYDPAPEIFSLLQESLIRLEQSDTDPVQTIVRFEVRLLKYLGVFPNLEECSVCLEPISADEKYAFWISQGGLLCGDCRRQEYSGRSTDSSAVRLVRDLAEEERSQSPISAAVGDLYEGHRLALSVITATLGRRPKTLRYLSLPK